MKNFLANLFVPRYQNSYFPYLLRKRALVICTLVVVGVNLLGQTLGLSVLAGSVNSAALVDLANKERAASDLRPLEVDSRLTAAAYAKAENIFELQYWSHYGPNGETPWQFIIANGYDYVYAGENLAKGFSSSESVHSAWMASKTHRENIMNAKYEDVGIAVVPGELNGSQVILVVQMFGSVTDALPETSTAAEEVSYAEQSAGGAVAEESIEIAAPPEGAVVGDNMVTLEGTSSDGIKNVGVIDNDVEKGDVICDGGVWDYRPENGWDEGDHDVEVVNEVNGVSDRVNFSVDTTPPMVLEDSLEVSGDSGVFDKMKISVQVEGEVDEVILVVGDTSIVLNRDGEEYNGTISGMIASSSVESKIIASDAAGNISVFDITDNVLGALSVREQAAGILGDMSFGDFSRIFTRVAVIIIALVLFIDAIYLIKLNILHTRGKTLFPVALWVIVIGVGMFAASTKGTIL